MRLPGRPRWPGERLPGWRRTGLLAATWLVVALPLSVALFLHGSRNIVLAGHDAVLRPSLDGWATLDLGPYLPDLRYPTGGRLGARIALGKTTADSYPALIRRYAFLASQPGGQVRKVRSAMTDLALDKGVDGALLALAAPLLVVLVGRRRWAELSAGVDARRTGVAVVALSLAVVGVSRPWEHDDPPVEPSSWQPLARALPEVTVPAKARPLQIESGLITRGSRRLVASAVASYRRSVHFYTRLAQEAPSLRPQLRQPRSGEQVGLLVSDRHDNVGMDPVARALADAGGATFLLDAGDDTSTGGAWETFSLESLDDAFQHDDERFSVAGNHDHGDVVTRQARQLGFTTLDGRVVDGPDGTRLLGASDPRSSGLGTWLDQHGITIAEQERRLADVACRHSADGDRVDLLMVHDAISGQQALDRGCVDLVVGGHLHEQVGPTRVRGAGGAVGYSYTNGTTGGAAYALAIGSKLRRDAEVTLVTLRDGGVVGLQPIVIDTLGTFRVAPWVALHPRPPTTG